MWRHAHRWPAVVLGIVLVLLSVTGSVLAVDPVLKRFDRYVTPLGDATLGDVLRISAKKAPHFHLDRVRIDYSGRVMLRGSDLRGNREVPLNLETQRLGRVDHPSDLMELMRRLHTTLNIGPQMRPVTFAAAAVMVLLLVSGAVLLVRRIGSIRQTVSLSRVRGHGLSKWHSVVGRLLVLPLFVTAFSGLWMSAVTLELLPTAAAADLPESTKPNGGADVLVTDFKIWDTIPLTELTELTFPIASDWWDVYVLRTSGELTYIDQFTGEVLSRGPVSFWVRALDLFTMLHTGRGAMIWGAMAGIFALSVPFFTITGVWLWLSRRQRIPNVPGLVRPASAQTAILVGSESGSTWGYAAHLAKQLIEAGRQVSLGSMNAARNLAPDAQLLVLTATYGDGTAPSGAAQFLPRLPRLKGGESFAVLGFGDTSFPAYCRFATDCHSALEDSNRRCLLGMGDVNRGSPQSFAAWGRVLGPALGLPELALHHEPVRPKTRPMVLLERTDFATDGQSRAAILRFDARGLKRFAAGDLLSVYPKGDNVARLYSLASSSRDKVVELCVVRVEDGLCSNQLLDMQIGDVADVVVTPNLDFRAPRKRPCLMIAAGTGIAPFAGMIRANRRTPIDLYFGLRHPDQDFYYRDEIARWKHDGRVARFSPAFSRHDGKTYVQDRLADEADHVAARLKAGASVMVCGSVAMGRAVAEVIDRIAATSGTSLDRLRDQGRYLEDVY